LVRVIAGLCRQAGGELRVKGELVDAVGEATILLKSWDAKTQELVLHVGTGSFSEVYKVVPEKEVAQPKAAQLWKQPEETEQVPAEKKVKTSTLEDNEKLTELENKMKRHRIARLVKEEMQERVKQGNLQL
jgi:hypothetical protein